MSDNALIDKLLVERKSNAERFFKKYADSDSVQSLSAKILNYLTDDDIDEDDDLDHPDDPELTLD